jgi:hypothetical protein
MTAGDRLLRSYRRLMWAYPRWYRRERGAELLSTLLDDADPGRRRASFAEARDLIGGGIRTRLRPPRTLLARLVAGQVALYLASVGAALGVLLSGYPGPPAEDRSVAAAMIAVPEQPRNLPGPATACDTLCPEPPSGDDVMTYRRAWDHTDTVRVDYHPPWEQAAAVVVRARERLAAAGWQTSQLTVQDDGIVSFEASDGRLDLIVTGSAAQTEVGAPVTVVVGKTSSALAVTFLVGGAAAGLLAGWVIAAWALQRLRRHRATRRFTVVAVAAPFLLLGGWISLEATWITIVSFSILGPDAKNVKAPLVVLPDTVTTYWAGPAVIAVSGLVALGLAALPGPGREPAQPRQPVHS